MFNLDAESTARYHKAMRSITIKAAAASLLLFVAGSVAAANCLPRVRDGWIRLAPAGMSMPMLAGYGRIENPCPEAVAITGAKSASFADISLHRTSVVDGISRMRPVPALPVGGNGQATLEPGGLHLMLMQPSATLKPGDTVRMVFTLQDGREVRGEFIARAAQ
jgi:periplasmic copper chaperone A